MTREELFDAWAPESSPWSQWAKPVLFAQAGSELAAPATELPSVEVGWAPGDNQTALVLEVPGDECVALGVALADRGFQPVPLFNGVTGPSPVVPTETILRALVTGAPRLLAGTLPAIAPPAFMLDSRRMPNAKPRQGQFDNRWLVFPQDFPSSAFLLSRGITAVVVVQATDGPIAEDLLHVLFRWQEADVRIYQHVLGSAEGARRLKVSRPSGFRSLLRRVMVTLRLKRNATGGFGAVVPIAAAGGGFG